MSTETFTRPIQCCCGGRVRCEDCRRDVCYCACKDDIDPTPQDRDESYGHVNATQARLDAWAEKWELTR